MPRGTLGKLVLAVGLAISLVQPARAQVAPGATISVADPHPLAKAAEILMQLYGVPISFEDASQYVYPGDLPDAVEFRAKQPGRRTLPPRVGTLQFVPEPLAMSLRPVQPAEQKEVARVLKTILDQHERNGNPGKFKVLETSAGLVIVPEATRDATGTFVPNQSLLDTRITIPDVQHPDGFTALRAFQSALRTASRTQVDVEPLNAGRSNPVSANNEVARDVLIRILDGLHDFAGARGINEPEQRVKLTWVLTTEVQAEAASIPSYHLGYQGDVMMRTDANGRVTAHQPIVH